jgi:hypothetical protein
VKDVKDGGIVWMISDGLNGRIVYDTLVGTNITLVPVKGLMRRLFRTHSFIQPVVLPYDWIKKDQITRGKPNHHIQPNIHITALITTLTPTRLGHLTNRMARHVVTEIHPHQLMIFGLAAHVDGDEDD